MKAIFLFLVPLLLLGSFHEASANHLLGGELRYSLVSTNGSAETYKVTLVLIGDCSSNTGANVAFSALPGANPLVKLFRGSTQTGQLRLSYNTAESNIEITPVCPDEAGNTACSNINNPLPGIKKFVYDGNFTLGNPAADWRFVFDGSITDGSFQTSAGRSFIIQNAVIVDPNTSGASIMYLEATLNNTTGPNNSTIFTSLPTPFFCLNKASTYSLGAADGDNDLLQFSLIPAKTSEFTVIDYIAPFTAIRPLPTLPNAFNFNTTNGQMNFTPNEVKNCLVTNLVEEYRNGVMVGSTMREMTFIILDNCNNDATLTPVSGIENANITVNDAENLQLSVCEGQTANIAFDIRATDPNGDNTTVTYSNLPAGASMAISGNGTPNPTVHFTWNVNDAAPGNYIFYATYTDDGCPLVTTKTVAYTIKIIPHINKFAGGADSACNNGSNGKAWAVPQSNVVLDYNYRWVDSEGNTVRTINSTNGDTLKSIKPGTYKVYIRNAEGCGTNVIVHVGSVPLPEVTLRGDTTLCVGMPLMLETTLQDNVQYLWSTGDTTCCIKVTQPGRYSLTAINKCGSTEAGVQISYVKCNYCFFIPNAFSPNGDGKNDQFNIKQTCPADKYKLQIFNRWGELVFTTLSVANSWDGFYNGSPAESGAYFYVLQAWPSDPAQGEIRLKGDLTLIR
ncbi:gliding motility-associated C-terminal domain-containing protein [Taibaiella koreensis]|uniref:gliding motility-associated C-terminal domain-containing protein n=1 Tax=Taibaiella koreensis TaxID=1268548 RepID=UPI000E59FB66|nr:gliding motility-associated C-terminal domain-containing protein [Taibaiella koreensis]